MITPDAQLTMARFVVGMFFVTFAFPTCNTVALSVYTKVLGPLAQGTMLGVFLAAGSVAQLVTPLWSAYAYQQLNEAVDFSIVAGGTNTLLLTTKGLLFSGTLFGIIFRKVQYLTKKNNAEYEYKPLL